MKCVITQSFCLLVFCIFSTSSMSSDVAVDEIDVLTEGVPITDHSDHKLVRLQLKSPEEASLVGEKLAEYTNNSIDFWTDPSPVVSSVDLMTNSETLQLIQQFTSSHNMSDPEVLVSDIQSVINRNTVRPKLAQFRSGNDLEGFFRDFQRASSIMQFMEQLKRAYPHLVSIESIGKSYENRDLKILYISSDGARSKNKRRLNRSSARNSTKQMIWIDAGIHAREWLAPATSLYFAHSLVSKYGKDDSITQVLDRFDFVILPLVNPDGYEYSHTNDRIWRKNRSKNSNSDCLGTDLNRNFDFHWKESGSSSSPCASTFAGPRALSEVEARSVAQYIWNNRQRIRVYISLHSYSQMWLYPWGYKRAAASRNSQMEKKARAAVNAIRTIYGTQFRYGSSGAVLYPAAGGSDDWAFGVCGIPYAYTVELRPGPADRNGFLVPASEIKPSGVETTAGIVALVKDIIDHGDASL